MTTESTTGVRSWRPLAAGKLAARALAAVEAIAAELCAAASTPPAGMDAAGATLWHAALASGDAGRALFFAYLDFHSRATRVGDAGGLRDDKLRRMSAWQESHAARAVELLDRAVDGVAAGWPRAGLAAGLPGVAWVAEHLRGRLFIQEAEAGDQVDEVVLAWLSRREGDYDLLEGLAGLGVYAVERLPRPAAAHALELVVERLASGAQRTASGAAWFTPPERLPPAQRRHRPQGCYDLGVAHGAAGVVGLLGAACGAGVASDRALPLLGEAVRGLLSHMAPDHGKGRFPHLVAQAQAHVGVARAPRRPAQAHVGVAREPRRPVQAHVGAAREPRRPVQAHVGAAREPRRPGSERTAGGSRLAWCYGDLGIAATLAVAGQGARRLDWQAAAFNIARGAAGRPLASSGVVDAGLCHGAAGVAHLFNRLYQASGEASLGVAARRWLSHALALRQPGRGAGGFRSWEADGEGRGAWYDDRGFLTGAAGIGLALLAAVSPVEPAWDRALLLSLRPGNLLAPG